MIDYTTDGELATITWNNPHGSANVKNRESIAAFIYAVERAIADPAVRGVVISSAKRDFIVGADVRMLATIASPEEAWQLLGPLGKTLRRMETSGKCFVAALNGSAIGGGLELALACHRRVAADNPAAKFGLPEVTLGLLPGSGGTQRLPRLVGLEAALALMLSGRLVGVDEALRLGLVDSVCPANDLAAACRRAALAEAASVQPWDAKAFRLPGGGGVQTPKGRALFMDAFARTYAQGNPENDAPRQLLAAVYQGSQRSMDAGLMIEAERFARVAGSAASKSMLRVNFSAMAQVRAGRDRPANVPRFAPQRLAVLGGGFMGAGIALAAAHAGIDVVVVERDEAACLLARERMVTSVTAMRDLPEAGKAELLARVRVGPDLGVLSGVPMVIEAVSEDMAVKAAVVRNALAYLPGDAVLATNTSTLPVSELSRLSSAGDRLVGMHFFSPVGKMPLVEIVRGKASSPVSIAAAFDLSFLLRKTPILVNDGAGFFTSRIITRYLREALTMVAEGVAPALIENAARATGLPVGPLAMLDETGIGLFIDIMPAQRGRPGALDLEAGVRADEVALALTRIQRSGRKAAAGFYTYPSEGAKFLWPGMAELFPLAKDQPERECVVQRLLYVQTLEALRCLQEGVIADANSADVASVLGWAFPAYRGGVVGQMVHVGIADFVQQCAALEAEHGERFGMPDIGRQVLAGKHTLYA